VSRTCCIEPLVGDGGLELRVVDVLGEADLREDDLLDRLPSAVMRTDWSGIAVSSSSQSLYPKRNESRGRTSTTRAERSATRFDAMIEELI
jgi:hypothetical protein